MNWEPVQSQIVPSPKFGGKVLGILFFLQKVSSDKKKKNPHFYFLSLLTPSTVLRFLAIVASEWQRWNPLPLFFGDGLPFPPPTPPPHCLAIPSVLLSHLLCDAVDVGSECHRQRITKHGSLPGDQRPLFRLSPLLRDDKSNLLPLAVIFAIKMSQWQQCGGAPCRPPMPGGKVASPFAKTL